MFWKNADITCGARGGTFTVGIVHATASTGGRAGGAGTLTAGTPGCATGAVTEAATARVGCVAIVSAGADTTAPTAGSPGALVPVDARGRSPRLRTSSKDRK